jgi:TatD DNase family protein
MSAPELIDIGANLTDGAFQDDLPDVLARADAAGVRTILVTGTTVDTSRAALELARLWPARLRSTAGIHPHYARLADGESMASLRQLAADPWVVAIGETGLDFNRDFSPRPVQENVFEQQLALACELQRPLFLHQRDAHTRFLAILKHYRPQLPGAVAHCFTGTADELGDYLDLDLHIGITGWICDERRGLHLRELVREIPLDRLLLETDSPYLVPRDLRPKPRKGRNEPAFLPHILAHVAACRGEDPATIAAASRRNSQALFRL